MSRAPIAVIGMALRVPGAHTPQRLWDHILAGRDTLTRPSRDKLRQMGYTKAHMADPTLVCARSVMLCHFTQILFAVVSL